MRTIRSFDDVQQVLRDIEDTINEFRAKGWDLNQRRITNVHPSRDEYDVVVRKELMQYLGTGEKPKNIVVGDDYDISVFGAGINSAIEVGTDINPRSIIAFPSSIVKCYAIATDPPTGCNLIFDVKRYHSGVGTSIFITPPQIIAGSSAVHTWTAFSTVSLSESDTLGFDILQVGNENPGGMLVVKIKIKRAL